MSFVLVFCFCSCSCFLLLLAVVTVVVVAVVMVIAELSIAKSLSEGYSCNSSEGMLCGSSEVMSDGLTEGISDDLAQDDVELLHFALLPICNKCTAVFPNLDPDCGIKDDAVTLLCNVNVNH